MTALDETPAPAGSVWCNVPHPFLDLVLCRRVRHSREVLHSPTDGGDDWAETVRVSPPTTSNEETPNVR